MYKNQFAITNFFICGLLEDDPEQTKLTYIRFNTIYELIFSFLAFCRVYKFFFVFQLRHNTFFFLS